jgi:hypothetical protein
MRATWQRARRLCLAAEADQRGRELEADVNNGGFAQYLDNKGRRRAGEALRALRRVGARATARLLEDALRPELPQAARRRLDDRFYEGREDLARLAFRRFMSREA